MKMEQPAQRKKEEYFTLNMVKNYLEIRRIQDLNSSLSLKVINMESQDQIIKVATMITNIKQ